MHALLQRRIGDLGRRQADALIDHLEAGVARAHRDLLGAVGMAVEAGLAHQHLEPPAEPGGDPLHRLAHRRQAGAAADGRGTAHAGGGAILAIDLAQRGGPFAGGDAGMGAGDGRLHDVAAVARGGFERGQAGGRGLAVAGIAPGLEASDLRPLRLGIEGEEAAIRSGGQRRGRALGEAIHPDDLLLAGLDGGQAPAVGFHQLALHIALLDGGDGPAQGFDARQLRPRLGFEGLDLGLDHARPVEDVLVVQEIGLIGQDLLQAQRPLLVPGPRQAQRLVPGRQLHGARAGALGERDRQHLQQDAIDVVLRLLLGEAEGIHLHAIAEAPELLIGNAPALAAELVPELGEGAHLADLGDEADAGIDEEADAARPPGRTRHPAPGPSP